MLTLPEPLVAVLLLVQPDPADEPALVEQLERPVDGRAADLLPARVPHPVDEVVRVEVLVRGKNLFEERRPLSGRLQTLALQELREDLAFFSEICHEETISQIGPY